MLKVKICGITNLDDALAAVKMGADALGFVLTKSPRQVSPQTARDIIAVLPPGVAKVGVFLNQPVDEVRELREFCGLDMVQLHGEESEVEAAALEPGVIKAFKIGNGQAPSSKAYPGCWLLLDTYHPEMPGGTGQTFDWSLARGLARQRDIFLAGGLHPGNVGQAIKEVNPYAVDVSSGVEMEPGRKDHGKIASFIAAAKSL